MQLMQEQRAILAGSEGDVMARCMRTLVEYGKAFDAPRLVPIKSAHLTGSFKIASFKGYYELLQRIVDAGLRVSVPTTLNPHPGYEFAPQNRYRDRFEDTDASALRERLGRAPASGRHPRLAVGLAG